MRKRVQHCIAFQDRRPNRNGCLKTPVKQPVHVDVAHRRQEVLRNMRVCKLELGQEAPQLLTDGPGLVRADTGCHGNACVLDIASRDFLGDVDQGPDKPEISGSRDRHRRQGTETPREQRVPQQRFA